MTVKELVNTARFETIIIKDVTTDKICDKNVSEYLDKEIISIRTQFSIPSNSNMVKSHIIAFIDDEEAEVK